MRMPKLSKYSYTGPVDHTVSPDRSQLIEKSVVVTGGANGLGEEFVRQFCAAGAYVTFGDVNEERGRQLEAELNDAGAKARFVKCNITNWDDQVAMFEQAIQSSPHSSLDIVIANAGISRSSGDSLWKLDGEYDPLYQ